jgi:hypothetical protein
MLEYERLRDAARDRVQAQLLWLTIGWCISQTVCSILAHRDVFGQDPVRFDPATIVIRWGLPIVFAGSAALPTIQHWHVLPWRWRVCGLTTWLCVVMSIFGADW